jgi:hypothetical protein
LLHGNKVAIDPANPQGSSAHFISQGEISPVATPCDLSRHHLIDAVSAFQA